LLWVLVFLLLTLVVVYAAFFHLYRSYRNQLEAELGERLIAVASGTATAVRGPVWEALKAGDSTAAAGLRADLQELRRTTGVSDIFLFTGDDRTLFDLGDRYPVGELNLAVTTDVASVTTARAGLAAATPLWESQGSVLKSAYAPVLDRSGAVMGAVGVEAGATFSEILDSVRGTLFGAAVLVLVGMLVLGVGFLRLIQGQQRLETRLRRTETLAAMGQMAAMLAHEIRNPLGIIRGAAERLAERHGLGEDEVYRFIPEEVDRLERTLGNYLDFARPAGGEGHDAREALERTLRLMRDELEQKGIELIADTGSGAFPVRGDAHQLQQVFLNLLWNARDAMPEGGTVTVSLRARGPRITVTVSDTGIGMEEAVRLRATEPFFSDKEKGSGLGLAVVSRVIADLGGDVEIQSRVGAGTRVSIALPRETSPGRSRG
jgi:signal transduction histidine kinase